MRRSSVDIMHTQSAQREAAARDLLGLFTDPKIGKNAVSIAKHAMNVTPAEFGNIEYGPQIVECIFDRDVRTWKGIEEWIPEAAQYNLITSPCTGDYVGDLQRLIAVLRGIDHAGEEERENSDTLDAVPYSTRTFLELAQMELPEVQIIWGGIPLIGGTVAEFIGPPGIGKSRAVNGIAFAQVLGRPFGGLPTLARPLKWLVIGSENSKQRLAAEVKKISRGLSPDELPRLANIRAATLERAGDTDISLADADNVARWCSTIAVDVPDVLVIDPFGDIQKGEMISETDVRATVAEVRKIGLRYNPEMVFVIINHARMGSAEEARATGFDAGNYGRGSRALYSQCRVVWNIRHGATDDNNIIEFIHAKNNDGPRCEPFAVRLDVETMQYVHVADFDHDALQADLEAAARGKGTGNGTKAVKDYSIVFAEAAKKSGDMPQMLTDFVINCKDGCGTGEKAAAAIVRNAVARGELASCKGPRKTVMVGTAEQVENYKKQKAVDTGTSAK